MQLMHSRDFDNQSCQCQYIQDSSTTQYYWRRGIIDLSVSAPYIRAICSRYSRNDEQTEADRVGTQSESI